MLNISIFITFILGMEQRVKIPTLLILIQCSPYSNSKWPFPEDLKEYEELSLLLPGYLKGELFKLTEETIS